ncbi:MAG: YegS/Rv2252/BmrU family lipid kinase [Kurthia sp.]|nr:YegS/Rv2252/BmrU family lipid kinase [Candidatus Kurthia equi]
MQLVLIINDIAGHGKAKKLFSKLKKDLTVPYKVEHTKYVGHASEIADQYGQGGSHTCLLTIGGDGTIHEVISGAASYDNLLVAVMNGGSGNDFGRAYPTFNNAQQIEQFIAQPSSQLKDLGTVYKQDEKIVFMNNCGFGIDAMVTRQVNLSTAKKYFNKIALGKLVYVWILFRELYKFKTFRIEISMNGQTYTYDNSYFVVVSNQPYFGGGMKVSPNSNTEDGMLELTVVNNIAKWRLLVVFASVFFGKHTKLKAVNQYQCAAFDVKLSRDVIGHADGEYIGESVANEVIHYEVQEKGWRLAVNKLD